MHPTHQYAQDVVSGKKNVCKWVKLACKRHLKDLTRTDIWFDEKAANRFFRWSEIMRHYKGPEKGKPIVLDDWQRFIFGNAYGWKKVENGQKTDIWRFNYVYIEIPRKNGKTTMAGVAASYDCAAVEGTGAEVYCLATKEDQAKLLYNDVSAFIAGSPDLQEVFEILHGRNTIFSKESNRTSFVKPLGADSQRHDGLNPLAAYCDEVHAWPDRKLWDVTEDAFGARTNWHMVSITTSGSNRQGICYLERSHLTDILEGRIEADNKFGVIYTVDDEEKGLWRDEKIWFKANPALGKGKQLQYMRDQAIKAEQMPSKLNTFLNKQLDIWTDVAEAWLNYDTWKSRSNLFLWETMRGLNCHGGMDLARVGDLSAVAYWFPPQKSLTKARVLVDFYFPSLLMSERIHQDKVPYDLWAQQGFLKLTPGNTTDFKFIEADILARSSMYNLQSMGYDRHFGGELVNSLSDEGVEMVEFGMGFASMGAPTAEFERQLVAGEMEHNDNPVLNSNAACVSISRDPAGNIKPDKLASTKRIDGIVAAIIALGRTMAPSDKKKPSVYLKRGIRTLG